VAGTPMAGNPGAGTAGPGARHGGPHGAAAAPDARPVSAVTCSLPGAAVGPTIAVGVSAALRRARLLRRRRRQAGPPAAGLFRHDPFAGDLSRELDRFALARGGLACDLHGAVLPVAVGDLDGREVGVDLAAHALAVVGEQADDTVRALALTVLAARPLRSVRVLVAGGVLPPNSVCPGLDRAPTLDAALTELEAELDHREATGDGLGSPIVLATSGVPPSDAARLDAVLGRGQSSGVTAVIAGVALDHAATLTLAPGAVITAVDEVVASLAGTRAFTLGPQAAIEVVDVLTDAFTDDRVAPPAETDEAPFPVLSLEGAAAVEVQLLGAYRILAGGTEIKSGLRAKARELLAFYLLHPEGTTLDAATEALWPEADPGRGSEWFWTALGNLRSLLRNAVGVKELKVIERDGDRYRIEPIFDVDLWRFQRALPSPNASTGDPEWARALSSAADLYAGELLADVDWAWVEVPREDLRRRAVEVLVALAATRLLAGETRSGIDALARAVEVDPLAEQAYRRMMRAHAKLGHPDEVAATLRRLESRLAEVGLEPTPESVRLAAELAKEPSLAGMLPADGR
jgi:DNA-binding SARP family transcriptional activator